MKVIIAKMCYCKTKKGIVSVYVRKAKEIAEFFNVDEIEVRELLSKHELNIVKDRYPTDTLWKLLMLGLESKGDLNEIEEKWQEIRKKRYRTQVSVNLREKIIKRDKNICRYCDKNLNKHNRVIDHILPWSKGGRNIEENLALSCKTCNSQKDNKTLEELKWILKPIPK
jgi:hypothetical protein